MAADSPSSFLPGFDFLKGLASQAGKGVQGLPGMQGLSSLQQWVTPVLDPDELDKRIEELRTVHFWLEQNAKLLSATIQALEVQKMTLTTLRSMNVPMPDLKSALRAMGSAVAGTGPNEGDGAAAATGERSSERSNEGASERANERASEKASEKAAAKSARSTTGKAGGPAADAIDPMAWWGSLTEQFAQIAAKVAENSVSAPVAERATSKKGASSEARPARAAKGGKRPSARSSATRRSRSSDSGK